MHRTPQAGQRALSLLGSGTMASASFIKDTGTLRLLLLGVLLPTVLVPGVASVTTGLPSTSPTDGSATAAPNTQPQTTMDSATSSYGTPVTSTAQPPTITSGSAATITTTLIKSTTTSSSTSETPLGGSPASASTTSQSLTTTSGGTASTTNQSPTTTSGGTTSATSQSLTTTSGGTVSTTNQSPTTTSGGTAPTTQSAMTQSSIPMTVSSWTSSPSMNSGSGSSTSMMSSSQSSNSTDGMAGTTTYMNAIWCPSFMCNYSDCYTMYTSQNATPCAADASCQLLRQTDMCYLASCSASCAESCVNASQTNCSVNCCNSTGCLNGSFASMMMMTTTVMATTTTARPAPTTTTSPPTTEDKRNKCHNGTCTGADCYKTFAVLQACSSTQPHCQLKKETQGSTFKWMARCTNCTDYKACKTSVKPPCHLECCNATMTSCLWLNGTLNVPSFATRGPYLHIELIASLLCLLAITSLL